MQRFSVQLFAVIGSFMLVAGCDRPPASETRKIRAEPLRETWTARFDGPEQAIDFSELLLIGEHVLLLDEANASVRALSMQTGDFAWTTGRRGAGPGEFLAPEELVDAGFGRFGVADGREGRLTVFRGPAVDTTEGTWTLAGQLNSYCRESDGSIVAIHAGSMATVRLRKGATPDDLDTLVWPNPVFNEANELRQARFARSREGRCIVWQVKGDYFFEFQSRPSSARRFQRYAHPYPEVQIDRSGPYPRPISAPSSTGDAAVLGDSLFVLRGSMYKGPGGMIDVYLLSTGQLVRSYTIPHQDVYQLDVLQELLVALRNTDNGSIVSAYLRP